jgi:curved DNA-binding protein CbpA
MDPYHTLGIAKDCTREELKDAFRAKARLVHPDRGGEPATFIQLRQAYDQIVTELERRPPGLIAETSARPSRPDPRPKQPNPNWEPDLILLDEPPDRTRPPGSPDPNWEPDLILLDEEPHHGRTPEWPDPNWEPDLILFDDEPRHGRVHEPLDPRVARRKYLRWLARLSARSRDEDSILDETWLNISGALVLCSVIIITIWICVAAWNYEPARTNAFEMTPRNQDLRP